MSRTSSLATSALAALVAALAVAAGTARADDGLQITSDSGCAVQCVKKALVTPTASSAKVEIETTVLAVVAVSVGKQPSGGSSGSMTASSMKTVKLYMPAGVTRTATFDGLDPDTSYWIALKATDVHGRSWTRTGSFKTLPAKTNGIGGPSGLDSGAGCSVQCITKALFKQVPPDGSIAAAQIETSADAQVKLAVARDSEFFQLVTSRESSGFVRAWKTNVTGLLPGTTYHAWVRAIDRHGHAIDRKGTFRTVSATALVTIQKIKIVADGDKGSNKGELAFAYKFAGKTVAGRGYKRHGSGDVIWATTDASSRRGVSHQFSANGDATFDVRVKAMECDETSLARCFFAPDTQDTEVGGTFRLKDILSGVLPGWFGTGVSQPPGHDAYFVFGPADDYVKIQVLATVDFDYKWPS